jgi:hypothetical protein
MAASTQVTRIFCQNLKQKANFAVTRAECTTGWAKSVLGPAGRQAQYLSRQVIPFGDRNGSMHLVIPEVRSFVRGDDVWMAIPAETVLTIADAVGKLVPLAGEAVQRQDLTAIPGHTAFPTFFKYRAQPREGWYEGDRWNLNPKLKSGTDDHEIPRETVEQGALGEVDFNITMAYRGEKVAEADWEATPMSLRFRPYRVYLPGVACRQTQGEPLVSQRCGGCAIGSAPRPGC